MTQEDKELLLKDLCARLPYHVIVNYNGANVDLTQYARSIKLKNCKPYLRPMSDMTEEEQHEYNTIAMHTIVTSKGFVHIEATDLIDWLNSHHFDYRALIDRGLAIEVTSDNNPYN